MRNNDGTGEAGESGESGRVERSDEPPARRRKGVGDGGVGVAGSGGVGR